MLEVENREQLEHIAEILGCDINEWSIGAYPIRTLQMEEPISFDAMTRIVDYLRSIKPKKNCLDMAVVAPQMMPAVDTWLAYKKEKNQSYKPTGFKSFYKKLCELSGNDPQKAMAIIEQSMANNYAGIFELKQSSNYGRETITDKIRRTVEGANEFKQRIDANIGREADMGGGDSDEVW